MPQLFSGKVLITLLLLTVLDLCITPVFGILRPVLGYLLVTYAVFFAESSRQTAGVAIMAGMLRDLAGIEPLGVETAVLLLNAMILCFIVPKIERESHWMRSAIVFVFVFMVFLFRLAVSAFLTGYNAIPADFLSISFFSAFSTAMISPFFFYLIMGWFGNRPFLKQYELFK